MQKDKLNIKDIVEKLKEIELKSHKSDVPTSIYDNLILYLESQNLRQNIIKDDSNNVFRAFSDAMNKGQLNYKPIKEKLVEKLHESHNQLKHILKLYLEVDPEDYLDRLDIASVDPMIELGFLLQIYNKNLRLFYFYEDSSLMEIKLPASSADAEYITLFYFKSMFHTVKDVKTKTEETKINLATFNKQPKPLPTPYESKNEESKIDQRFQQFDINSGNSSSKSKSSVFASGMDINELAASKRTPIDRKANYRKKGMSSTSGAFLPPSKESKPLSPPPGFDPLPTKPQGSTMKSGFSSSVVHTNQNLFTPIQSYSGAMSMAPQTFHNQMSNNELMQPMEQPKLPMGMSNVRSVHEEMMPSYPLSTSSNYGSMTMMSGSHINRMPSATLPQTAKQQIYSIPMIRSEVIPSKLPPSDKYPIMSSYMMPIQKDESVSQPAPTENITEFYKQYMDHLTDPAKKKQTGVLKFFNDGKGFGFLISDSDGKDVFFHYDDIKDVKLSKEFLRDAKNKYIAKFAYEVQVYYGKYNISSKAVNLELLGLFDQRFLLDDVNAN